MARPFDAPALALACALLAAPAAADPGPDPLLYGGLSAGGHAVLTPWDFGERDADAVPVSPEGSVYGGLRLGVQPLDGFAIEADAGYLPFPAADEVNPGLLYTLGLRYTPFDGLLRPHAAVGVGLYHNLAPDQPDRELDGTLWWGLGARGPLSGPVWLRVDLRHLLTDSLDLAADYADNLLVTLGVDLALYTPPTDRDGDGVEDEADACPDTPGARSGGGCPDQDGDRVVDTDDRCPDAAGLAALGGCPDGDGDGVPDADDACPELAGVADAGGCPPDSDGDGLRDDRDQCPDAAEDLDGLADDDGCPEDDVDGDGVADADDRCPQKPETANGFEDADGCPDTRPAVVVTCERFELDDRIYFQPGRFDLEDRSRPLLDKVAAALLENPWITRIRIEGHTDDAGDAATNKRLSQQRVWVVRGYLADKGVDKARLRYAGFGEERPIADNATEEGRAQNRRVEFVIVEKEDRPECAPPAP